MGRKTEEQELKKYEVQVDFVISGRAYVRAESMREALEKAESLARDRYLEFDTPEGYSEVEESERRLMGVGLVP